MRIHLCSVNLALITIFIQKTEVDGLVGAGGGYGDTQLDGFLSLKEDKSALTDNISFSQLLTYQDLV